MDKIAKDMKIVVADIPEEGLFLNYASLEGHIPALPDDRMVKACSGRLEVTRSGSEVHVRGWVEAQVQLGCDRCLEPVETEVSAEFFYLLRSAEEFSQDLAPELEVTEENVQEYWYEDGEIQAGELFREQIVLQLPVRILCSEGCKGLCPGCGADLNKEECRCEEDHGDSPFAVLKGLLKQ